MLTDTTMGFKGTVKITSKENGFAYSLRITAPLFGHVCNRTGSTYATEAAARLAAEQAFQVVCAEQWSRAHRDSLECAKNRRAAGLA